SSREWLDRHLERALEGTRVGPYLIVRRLGAGGQGVVFEARQERPDRRVALKLLLEVAGGPRERRRRCLDVAEALLRLRHPHVVQVTDAGVHRERVEGRRLEVPYLALEMVVGARTLLRYADEERLETADRLTLFVTVCDAVAYGHCKAVVHGD